MSYTVNALGIRKSFGGNLVLDGVDLAVPTGSIFALLGPNGAGKTTLVRILATLIRPDAGTATIAGHDLVADPDGVRRSISLTGQYTAVDDVLTGEENLQMMARLLHLAPRAARARAAELLSEFGLGDARHRRVKSYSGGMRRRLDLAISMIANPRLLFLDEPTNGLDPRSREQLWGTVRGLADAGVTVLLTTQYLEEADQLAGTIAMLHHGRIVAEGTANQLKSQPRWRGRAAAVRRSPGHIVASLARNLLATTLVIGVGLGVGWRPVASPAQWLAAAAMTVAFILAISWFAAAFGLLVRSPEAANSATFLIMFLPYISTAFVPANTMPAVLRPVAANQPFTPVIETLRGLWMGDTSTGAAVGHEAWIAVGCCAAILAVSFAAASWLFRHRTAG